MMQPSIVYLDYLIAMFGIILLPLLPYPICSYLDLDYCQIFRQFVAESHSIYAPLYETTTHIVYNQLCVCTINLLLQDIECLI